MTQLPGPLILTAKTIAEKVMGGETITIPIVQFSQFLWEADEDKVEFCMKADQKGMGVVFTCWDTKREGFQGLSGKGQGLQ